MQTGFAVGVLPGVAQRLVDGRFALTQRPAFRGLVADFAKAAILPAPAHRAIAVGDLQRRAVQISGEPVAFSVLRLDMVIDSRQRAPGFVRIVQISGAALPFPALQQAPALPQEAGFHRAAPGGDRFRNAPAQGVVAILLLMQAVAALNQIAARVITKEQVFCHWPSRLLTTGCGVALQNMYRIGYVSSHRESRNIITTHYSRSPSLHLKGDWLREAEFDTRCSVTVKIEAGCLLLTTEQTTDG